MNSQDKTKAAGLRRLSNAELDRYWAGRRAARDPSYLPPAACSGDPHFKRGYAYESLFVRADNSEILLVAGLAVQCSNCGTKRLYNLPGCGCWVTDEVAEIALWMKNPQPLSERIGALLRQYRLRYGVMVYDPGLESFQFVETPKYYRLLEHAKLPVIEESSGEAFFLNKAP